MICQRLGGKRIKAATLLVALELTIPLLSIKRDNPVTEHRKIVSRQLTDGLFNLLDAAHADTCADRSKVTLQ